MLYSRFTVSGLMVILVVLFVLSGAGEVGAEGNLRGQLAFGSAGVDGAEDGPGFMALLELKTAHGFGMRGGAGTIMNDARDGMTLMELNYEYPVLDSEVHVGAGYQRFDIAHFAFRGLKLNLRIMQGLTDNLELDAVLGVLPIMDAETGDQVHSGAGLELDAGVSFQIMEDLLIHGGFRGVRYTADDPDGKSRAGFTGIVLGAGYEF